MTATTVYQQTAKQRQAYRYLFDRRTKFVGFGGSAGGGKSWLGSEWLMGMCVEMPGTRWFMGRNNIKDARESFYVTFNKVAKKHGTTGFRTNDNGIIFSNGSEISLLDLTYYPRKDPLFERFGSKEFTGGWIEEGGEIDFGAFDVLKTRVGRHLNVELDIPPKILVTFNPKRNWLYTVVYDPWRNGQLEDNWKFVQSLPSDNPHLSEAYLENLRSIKNKATRERLLNGNWDYDDSPDILIPFAYIEASWTADHNIKDPAKKYITTDVAMQGSDKFVVGVWYGRVLVEVHEMEKSGGKQIVDLVKTLMRKHGIAAPNVAFDSDGVGAFIGGSGGFIPGALAYHGGARPMEFEGELESNYKDLKTQCSYHCATAFTEGKYWLQAITDVGLRQYVAAELDQIRSRDADKDNKIQLKRKEDVRRDLGRSPDYADMIVIREFFEMDHASLPQML